MRLFACCLALVALTACKPRSNWTLHPPKTIDAPVRTADRVYILTQQLHTRFDFSIESFEPRIAETFVYTDIWAFDSASAAPLWRKRLDTEKRVANSRKSFLGAEGEVLWILLPGGLVAVDAATGAVRADSAAIEAANPSLHGLLPKDRQYIHFAGKGLILRAADGREWRLHPNGFKAETPGTAVPSAHPPAYLAPSSPGLFQQRDLDIPGRYLGVLTDAEAAQLRDRGSVGDLDFQSRRKLWGGRRRAGTDVFRPREIITELAPLTSEFLAPGLLSLDGRPLLTRNPDSVLILHQDRLGEDRRLWLTRVTGPAGQPLWKTQLPLSLLQAVMPGEETLLLYGAQFVPPQEGANRGDPLSNAHEILVSIRLSTGAMQSFDQSDISRHPEAR